MHDPDLAPPLVGEAVELQPVAPRSYEMLWRAEQSEALAGRWRQRGRTPSLEAFQQGLWQQVLAQFLVVDREAKRPIGLVTAYNPNLRHRWAYLAVVKFDLADKRPHLLSGAALFINYLFENWELRKLYAETVAFNLDGFGSAIGDLFVEEGRLRDHEWYAGQWWDLVTLALYRTTWDAWKPVILSWVAGQRIQQPADRFIPTRDWPMTYGNGPVLADDSERGKPL